MATSQKKIKLSTFIPVEIPGREWGKGELKVLTVNGVRISPDTSSQGALSQLVRQEMGTKYLAHTIKNVDFSSVQMVNVAYHETRHNGFIDTEAFNLLKEQLKQHKDEFDVIIIWFSDVIRIGAKYEHLTMLKSELSEISDKISVLSLKDSGKDLEEVAKIVAIYLKARSNIDGLGSHVNAGSNLPRHPDFEDLAAEIRGKKSEIISEANSAGILDKVILDAAQHGETLKEISKDLGKVYESCVKNIEKNSSPKNVDKVAKRWIREVQTYQSHHEVIDGKRGVAIYLRTTDTTHELDEEFDEIFSDDIDGRKYLGDKPSLPVAQASGNLAANAMCWYSSGYRFLRCNPSE